mmetsp:Transcript_49195/g.77783  ORF Transcript_49195/g.77783 Transcript_49195/m.77783 type:complete len:89 (-) Transcript_49195:778-1044(-)
MDLAPPPFIVGDGLGVRFALITQEVRGVLSPQASIGWTALGCASAGVFLALIFALKRWLSPAADCKASSGDDDCEPLLPESGTCGPAG